MALVALMTLLSKAMTTRSIITGTAIPSSPNASTAGMNDESLVAPAPSVHDFGHWLTTAKPGETYTYAVRHVLDNKTPPETQAVALLAREAFARGEVELVHRRLPAS
jgi:hypothetical protein